MDRKETLALFKKGKDPWNQWAKKMLTEKAKLVDAGEWAAERDYQGHSVPKNETTKSWMEAARSDLSGCIFLEYANFSDFHFPFDANFTSATITDEKGDSKQQSVEFKKGAQFTGAEFGGNAEFDGAIFRGKASFILAVFDRDTSFRRADYCEEVSFHGAMFQGESSFGNAIFRGSASYQGAGFIGETSFNGARFCSDASFNMMRFDKAAYFIEASFMKSVAFNATGFSGYACFETAEFNGFANFTIAEFNSSASFRAITSDSAFSLENATFHILPDFRQAHFREAPGLDMMALTSSVAPGGFWQSLFRRDQSSVISKYRELKRIAIEGHDHEQEQQFWKGELRARRGATDHPWPFPPRFFLAIGSAFSTTCSPILAAR